MYLGPLMGNCKHEEFTKKYNDCNVANGNSHSDIQHNSSQAQLAQYSSYHSCLRQTIHPVHVYIYIHKIQPYTNKKQLHIYPDTGACMAQHSLVTIFNPKADVTLNLVLPTSICKVNYI